MVSYREDHEEVKTGGKHVYICNLVWDLKPSLFGASADTYSLRDASVAGI